MRIVIILLFLRSIINLVHGDGGSITTTCPSYSCRNYFSSQTQNACTYTNQTCQDHETPVVHLPYAGEFYVRSISYDDTDAPFIQLYDPDNCLLGRLMHHCNLLSSPYKAILYETYTYYMCPSNSDPSYYPNPPIKCLSNSTNSMVAVADSSQVGPPAMESGCKVIGSWKLPVLEQQQFEGDGVNSDLYLTWNLSTCEACQETQDQLITSKPLFLENEDTPARLTTFTADSNKFKKRIRKLGSNVFQSTPVCIALGVVFVVCLLAIIKCFYKTETANTDNSLPVHLSNETGAPIQPVPMGLDESKINVYTELVVLGGNRIISSPDSNTTCSICLEIYVGGETVRNIAICGHSFHAYCIELWLRRNITCPVCRTPIAVADC